MLSAALVLLSVGSVGRAAPPQASLAPGGYGGTYTGTVLFEFGVVETYDAVVQVADEPGGGISGSLLELRFNTTLFDFEATVGGAGQISGTATYRAPSTPPWAGTVSGTLVEGSLDLVANFPPQMLLLDEGLFVLDNPIKCTVDAALTAATLTASDAPDPVITGGDLTYTVEVRDPSGASTNLSVTMPVPGGTTFRSASTTSGTVEAPAPGQGGTVTVTIPAIASDEVVRIAVVVRVTAGPGAIVSFLASLSTGLEAGVDTFVLALDEPYLAWNPPDLTSGSSAPPPRNARVEFAGASPLGKAPGEAPEPPVVIAYKVYRSTMPNVEPDDDNLLTTLPPTQTTTGSIADGGFFYVVTACYASGEESPPSNEVGYGVGEPRIRTLKLTRAKVLAKGEGFVEAVQVLVDGVGFAAPGVLKKNNSKLIQKGALTSGQTLGEVLLPGKTVLLSFKNPNGAVANVQLVIP
jgi:uncharacterized repeat protein (TIGR01451 family)